MKTAAASTLPRFLADCLKTQRRRYCKRMERCQEKFSESAVHELRIQTRRVMALLDLLRVLDRKLALRKTRKVFKRRLDAFDELRDTHVQLVLLKTLRSEFPEVRELDAWLRRRERKLIADLRKRIRAAKQTRLEKRLKSLEKELLRLSEPPSSNGTSPPFLAALEVAFTTVAALRRAVRRRDTATIHLTRVAFKRYRYMAELLRVFLPGVTPELQLAMRNYQTHMGDIQDLEVLLAGLAFAEKKGRLAVAPGRRLRLAVASRLAQLVDDYLRTADALLDFEPSRLIQPASTTPSSKP